MTNSNLLFGITRSMGPDALFKGNATLVFSGNMNWTFSSTVSDLTNMFLSSGNVISSQQLDRLAFYTDSSFDAGTITLLYE